MYFCWSFDWGVRFRFVFALARITRNYQCDFPVRWLSIVWFEVSIKHAKEKMDRRLSRVDRVTLTWWGPITVGRIRETEKRISIDYVATKGVSFFKEAFYPGLHALKRNIDLPGSWKALRFRDSINNVSLSDELIKAILRHHHAAKGSQFGNPTFK